MFNLMELVKINSIFLPCKEDNSDLKENVHPDQPTDPRDDFLIDITSQI